ncbi:hypothetical protein PIB30_049844 [Stylosanthes scabra]|uniref:Uncharacterized protein n=1 Tax=Stylosanthes scabra TaxID=79078 RepID=A0ABU6YI40_9FABA|nr:hypothetical protein [Stylosanthes scabra]
MLSSVLHSSTKGRRQLSSTGSGCFHCSLSSAQLVGSLTFVQRISNGGRDTRFGTRRCAFDDKPYGVAESYSREGVNVEVILLCSWASYLWPYSLMIGPWRLTRNIAPTRELRAFRAKLASYGPFSVLFPGGSVDFR